MRIALINTLYFPEAVGGAERSVQAIAEGLVAAGAEVTVLTLCDQATESRDRINGVDVLRVPLRNIYWPYNIDRPRPSPIKRWPWHALDTHNPRYRATISGLLKTFKPNLVQTHNLTGFSTSCWSIIRESKIPLVHTLHDYSLICPRGPMMKRHTVCSGGCFECQLPRMPRRRGSAAVNAVAGVSDFVLKMHLDLGFFPNASIKKIIHNGNVPAQYTSEVSACQGARNLLRVGFIGTVSAHKGIEVLLAAVSLLPKEKVQVKIAGQGNAGYLSALREDNPADNIEFVGRVDPVRFFDQIDVLAVPSIWNEPFGRVIIEAFAHGIPVVASSVGGIPEILDHNINGKLIPSGDARALAAALQALIDNPMSLRSLSENARATANRFKISETVEAYLQMYQELLAK